MPAKKKVVVGTAHMHLWDEANNFIASYDRHDDDAMCRFLVEMINQNHYTWQSETRTPLDLPAVAAA